MYHDILGVSLDSQLGLTYPMPINVINHINKLKCVFKLKRSSHPLSFTQSSSSATANQNQSQTQLFLSPPPLLPAC